MLSNGDITSTQYAERRRGAATCIFKPGRFYTRIREPYFFSYVRDELQKQYGSNTVRSGGLRVYTTIDPRLQRFALDAIRDTLPYSTDPAAAIVSINPGERRDSRDDGSAARAIRRTRSTSPRRRAGSRARRSRRWC